MPGHRTIDTGAGIPKTSSTTISRSPPAGIASRALMARFRMALSSSERSASAVGGGLGNSVFRITVSPRVRRRSGSIPCTTAGTSRASARSV
jgi:hypothetical protein